MGIKSEVKICAIIAILFFMGLFFRFMYGGGRMGVGLISYNKNREMFIFWAIVWFGMILGSLMYMYRNVVMERKTKQIILIRVMFIVYIVTTIFLAIPYFKLYLF